MTAQSTWVRNSDDALTAEVIVAGAGPGGATAARTLAAARVQTLLVEKTAFPRNKPCGGGISARALSRFSWLDAALAVSSARAS